MGFLESLGTAINEQFSFGENSVTSLDTTNDGRVTQFGLLGEFAKHIDKSAERSYVEDGFIRNIRPRLREMLWQAPDMTVVIKKRMFSSLAENFRLDLLEDNEKLFYRSSKRLFQNKCRTIAAYERLSKIEQVSLEAGKVNSYLFPGIVAGITDLQNAGLGNIFDDSITNAIDKIRKVYAFSEPTGVTTWLIDNELAFMNELGEGTGVMEFTVVSGFNSTVSTRFGEGNLSFIIENPYNILKITNEDIDRAISDSTNVFNRGFGQLIQIETKNLIDSLKSELNSERKSRGAAEIVFSLSPETLISKRLRILIPEAGKEINFTYNPGLVGLGSSVDLDPTASSGPNGLNSTEQDLVKQIVSNIFLLLGYQNTTRSQVQEWNEQTNYVRRKMRLHYSGKSVIQPMDIVNVFVTSHSAVDDKISSGFELQNKKLSLTSQIDNLVRSINTNFGDPSSYFEGAQLSLDEIEKAAIVGADFPTWLWRLMRNDFTRQAAGTCVFVGLVDSATRGYQANAGKHVINVSCKDNSYYFSKSQINLTPALDVWNGTLYDPLTPFNISFDAATGVPKTNIQNGALPDLLYENAILVQTGATKFKSYRQRGTSVKELLFKAKDMELGFDGPRRVLSNPDGFVYRWKEGIESITKTERAYPVSTIRTDTSPRLTKNPFAGQDVMNVLSLLITGQPYNFNTFLKAAIENGNSISNNVLTNQTSVVSYIDGLVTELSKRNDVWGNFIPFKKLLLSDGAEQFILQGRADFVTQNAALNDLLAQKAQLIDELALRSTAAAKNPQNVSASNNQAQPLPAGSSVTLPADEASLRNQLDLVNRQITSKQQDFQNTIDKLSASRPGSQILIIGDDLSYDPSYSQAGNNVTEEQRVLDRDDFRRRLDILTQRRLWKVKANDDTNLFIVDDQYDKSFDIQAFERAINGSMNLFSSEYTTVDSKIREVAQILGLEVFADSQGHIQARPPQYNHMPSTVFYRMFKERDRTGIKVFPEFLESLYFNQVQGIINSIEIVENNIRLRGTALGLVSPTQLDPDYVIRNFISGSASGYQGFSGQPGFSFLSDPFTGKIGDDGLQNLFQQANPDLSDATNNAALTSLQTQVQSSLKNTRLFDAVSRSNIVDKINFQAAKSQSATDNLFRIRQQLQIATGVPAPTRDQLFSNDRLSGQSTLDAIKVINEIAQYVSERQKLLMSLSSAIRNLTEGVQINSDNQGANTALFPQLHRSQTIPSILQHMIEDETNHSLGPGSGGRYVIRDRQIINLNVFERPPEYTAVTVNGLFDSGDQSVGGFVDAPANLNLDSRGGNAVSSAFAVDYDMWRMYGFGSSATVPAPFFFDPDSQCAPYAVFLLNLARKNILQASIELAGNEFYQAGDVVYIESEDLLFYVEQVKHNFNFGGTFTTSLELKYGHTPGEYIPTMLDIVGKILYNTRSFANRFRNSRFDSVGSDRSLGVLVFDNRSGFGGGVQQLLTGPTGSNNQKALNNILFAASGGFNDIAGRKSRLQLRVYTNSGSNGEASIGVFTQASPDANLLLTAEETRQWFINPQQFSNVKTQLISFIQENSSGNAGFGIAPDNIDVVTVDVSENSLNSPSSAAWNATRSILARGTPSDSDTEDVQFAGQAIAQNLAATLYTHIIDVWQVFEDVPSSITMPSGTPQNQFDQNLQAQANAAAQKLVGS